MICQNCKSEQPEGSFFCTQCGTKLEIQRFCPACNAKVASNARFCSQCGCNLAEGSVFNGISDNVFAGNVTGSFNSTTNTTIYQQIHHESTDIVHCDICGNMLSKGSGEVYSCKHCGRLCCSHHFDKEYNMCTVCSQEPRKQAEAKKMADILSRQAEEERKKQALMDAFGKIYEYRLNPATGKYAITGVKMKKITAADIPSFVDEIGDGAFEDCTDLTSISIPPSVTRIGKRAFKGCWGLSQIELPDSITAIEDETFYFCRQLKKISFAKNLQSIGKAAFSGTGVQEIVIPGTVKKISDSAFYFCQRLTSVTISEGVESISLNAFSGCPELNYVSLPTSLKSIDGGAFSLCPKLYRINYRGTNFQWMCVMIHMNWAWGSNIQQIFPEGGY